MNNEPVAWMVNDKIYQDIFEAEHYSKFTNKPMIPLYTHPHSEESVKAKEQGNPVAWRSQDPDGYWSVYQAPVEGAEPLYTGFKELTDEEIYQTWQEAKHTALNTRGSNFVEVIFARAILRKASEK